MYSVGWMYVKVPTTLQRVQKQSARTEKGLKKRKVKVFLNNCDIIVKITNEMQLYRLIYYSKSALHVSGDFFAHY